MGMRYGENFIIIKEDLREGFVKIRSYKGVVEYWIYKAKKSRIFKLDGKPAKLNNIDEAELNAIIVANDNYKEEKQSTYIIKGFRFDKQDLENYLLKTGRGKNG